MTDESQQEMTIRMDALTRRVTEHIAHALEQTEFAQVVVRYPHVLRMGKMLRGRLLLYLGLARRLPEDKLVSTAAAVEMLHAGSLFHDDIIDQALIRRGQSAYWKEAGPSAAILLGDMLFILAMKSIDHEASPFLLSTLLEMAGQVCQGEALQDMIWEDTQVNWERYIEMARMKTGALFAFAAGAVADHTTTQFEALRETGYHLGIAYQLADDVMDAQGSEEAAGKTLGQDHAHGKNTGASLAAQCQRNPREEIRVHCREAEQMLTPWPVLQEAWRQYMTIEMQPALDRMLQRTEG
ncbi:MAG: hypothetical protein EOM20_21690 [Spartobacteria bacterium]|nr:hypothetical protein [Spartobacteria bacterium]